MADEPSENANPDTDGNNNPIEEPKKLPDVKTETPSVPQTVKVDLGELRDLLEGLPEKTAQFIKEAVSTPKKQAAPAKSESKQDANPPAETHNDTPKQSTSPKKGWLANVLFGK